MNETELNRQMQENMQISVKFCFLFSGLYKNYFFVGQIFLYPVSENSNIFTNGKFLKLFVTL